MPTRPLPTAVKLAPPLLERAHVSEYQKFDDGKTWYKINIVPSTVYGVGIGDPDAVAAAASANSSGTPSDAATPLRNRPLSFVAARRPYAVWRRYDHFVAFHAALVAQLKKEPSALNGRRLPSLPKSRFFVTRAVCEERVAGLDSYLAALLTMPERVTRNILFAEFLGLWIKDMEPPSHIVITANNDKINGNNREDYYLVHQHQQKQQQQQLTYASTTVTTTTAVAAAAEAGTLGTNDNSADLDVPLDEPWLQPVQERRRISKLLVQNLLPPPPTSPPPPNVAPSAVVVVPAPQQRSDHHHHHQFHGHPPTPPKTPDPDATTPVFTSTATAARAALATVPESRCSVDSTSTSDMQVYAQAFVAAVLAGKVRSTPLVKEEPNATSESLEDDRREQRRQVRPQLQQSGSPDRPPQGSPDRHQDLPQGGQDSYAEEGEEEATEEVVQPQPPPPQGQRQRQLELSAFLPIPKRSHSHGWSSTLPRATAAVDRPKTPSFPEAETQPLNLLATLIPSPTLHIPSPSPTPPPPSMSRSPTPTPTPTSASAPRPPSPARPATSPVRPPHLTRAATVQAIATRTAARSRPCPPEGPRDVTRPIILARTNSSPMLARQPDPVLATAPRSATSPDDALASELPATTAPPEPAPAPPGRAPAATTFAAAASSATIALTRGATYRAPPRRTVQTLGRSNTLARSRTLNRQASIKMGIIEVRRDDAVAPVQAVEAAAPRPATPLLVAAPVAVVGKPRADADGGRGRHLNPKPKRSSALYRSHSLNTAADLPAHFIQLKALLHPHVVLLKLSRTVPLSDVLGRLAQKFSTLQSRPVAVEGLAYKDVEDHVITVEDEEDWVVCKDACVGRLCVWVRVATDPAMAASPFVPVAPAALPVTAARAGAARSGALY